VALKYDGEADIVTFTTAAMRSPQSLSVTRGGTVTIAGSPMVDAGYDQPRSQSPIDARLDAEQVSSRFGPHKVTADYVHGRFV
jgi:hypothetical protein